MAEDNITGSRKAALDFLRAGRKKEHKEAAKPTDGKPESGFELYNKYREMSDDEFNAGVADGTITPEKKRKAGEYFYNFWMGDVWGEGNDGPEPTYEEFMADPKKYGVEENEADPWNIHRFQK